MGFVERCDDVLFDGVHQGGGGRIRKCNSLKVVGVVIHSYEDNLGIGVASR